MMWGRMPISDTLLFSWYETPNIHFCTMTVPGTLCRDLSILFARSLIVTRNRTV